MFSFAYALAQQFYVLGYFYIRNFQSTDTNEVYSFEAYLLTRIFTVLVMVITAIGYLFYTDYNYNKVVVILMLILYRACEAVSDVYQGFFQQQSRSDLSGKIQFVRNVATLIVFGIGLALTNELLLSSFLVFLVNFVLIFPLDIAIQKKEFPDYILKSFKFHHLISAWSILGACFPLFINGYLITAIYNEPKLVIDNLLEQGLLNSGIQRDFNILFMPVFVLSLLFFIFRPFTTQLSEHWLNNEQTIFFKKVNTFFGGMALLSLLIIASSFIIGPEILGAVYGINLSENRLALTLLLVAGGLNVLSMIVDIILTIFRKQRYLLLAYLLTFIVSKIITKNMITSLGILGAAQSFLLVMMFYLLLSILIYTIVRWNLRKGNQ
ncbi:MULTISPECIES: lipopolysaccharide biosynthesis protein [unclassified Streptococcus]|uniref:lipopolysaccharide biosynthesis protein n=1 Tax=unclassified Streptococcus TaxID=2608887 RepID=UPI00359EF5B7